jgi:hypothetical protein
LTATIQGYPETSGDIFDIWQFNHNYLNYIIGKKFLQQTDSFDFTIVGSLLAVVLYNRRFGAEKNYKIGFFPRKNKESKYGSSELSGYIISNNHLTAEYEFEDLEQNMIHDCNESTFTFKYLNQLVNDLLGNTSETTILGL